MSVQIAVDCLIYIGTSSGGVYVVNRAADKIDFIHDHIVALRTGAAGQTMQTCHKIRFKIDSHAIETGKLPHVKTAAKMLASQVHDKGVHGGFICAGWDPYKGASLYSINLGGACLERNFTMSGSGSGFIYGYTDANYK